MVTLSKELMVVEDMVLSMDPSVTQERGVGTPFNAAYLPYTVSESVAVALNNRYTMGETDTKFALLAGLSTQAFEVNTATIDTHAIPKLQMDTALALKANETDVILKGSAVSYTPASDLDPVNKGYADGLIADKFLGAITGSFIAYSIADGTTPVTVSVTNGVITGIV